MAKTYEEINEKIRKQEAIVVTAEEMISVVARHGVQEAARRVDVVTTGTFGPMCSSGALLNIGHTSPRIKLRRAWLNDVPARCGLAAVDLYLGATELREGDRVGGPDEGRHCYGGAHVIEALVSGEEVHLRAEGHGTDCYPRTELDTLISLDEVNDAVLLNPRNACQNYNVAVNAGNERPIHTYLGILYPNLVNAAYSSAGQLSPLLNDPFYRTIGIGTRILLGGGMGFVSFHGTQHDPGAERDANGVPRTGAGTLSVIGDLKGMNNTYLRAVSIPGYGVSLAVGIAVPIPILDEQMARHTAVSDAEIAAPVVDYFHDYPNRTGEPLGYVTYAELRSGIVEIAGRKAGTSTLSNYNKARQIAVQLKNRIEQGEFLLGQPVEPLPGPSSGRQVGPLRLRLPESETARI